MEPLDKLFLPMTDILLLEVLIPLLAFGISQRCFACEHLQNLSKLQYSSVAVNESVIVQPFIVIGCPFLFPPPNELDEQHKMSQYHFCILSDGLSGQLASTTQEIILLLQVKNKIMPHNY